MTYLNRVISILVISLFAGILPALGQQASVDMNRMNRDINIMENILEEVFKINSQSPGGHAVVFGNNFLFGTGDGVRGTYLPGYGAIFSIPYASGLLVIGYGNSNDAPDQNYKFVYSSNGESDTEITEESVINRITEFLRDYGSTIGQLNEEDRVMVIFGANRSNRNAPHFLSLANNGVASKTAQSIPTISITAQKSDLTAYRSGQISDAQFRNRLSIAKPRQSEERQLDMQIMANIFETVFKETDDEGFRITGSVNHLRLDNFGALFSFDASYFAPGNIFSLPDIQNINRDDESRIVIAKGRDQTAIQNSQEQAEQINEATKKAYNSFKTQLKEFLVDYGRTIHSVESNQHIMVSVSLSSRNEQLPGQLDLRVEKSVLEAMDQGSMSRNNALGQVVVTEY